MATREKKHYYVLVFADNGAKYVTKIGEHHMAYWDGAEKPKEMSKSMAEDIARGLQWNGYTAVVVASQWEVWQPYRYTDGHFEWVEDKVEE